MRMKNKILLVADKPGWIFHRHCNELIKRMSHYDFEIVYKSGVKSKSADYYNSFDLIYILDTRLTIPFKNPSKTVIGVRCEFSYSHTDEGIRNFFVNSIKSRACAFHVVNKRQLSEFEKVADIPLFFAPHGVDTELFYGGDEIGLNDKLVVGMNGSKTSGGKKGFDIVESACNKLGMEFKTSVQDFKNGHLTKKEMPDSFYNKIDIYCNMSQSEGLNNSIMEAGAMGRCVIATPVGAATEMIIDNETGMLCARNVNELIEKLDYANKNREKIKEMGIKLKTLIKEKWSWSVCVKMFDELFKKGMSQ